MLNFEMPTIETERLILRPVRLEDADAIFTYASDPKATAFVGFATHQSVEDSKKVIQETYLKYQERERPASYAIELKDTHEMIGMCDCHTIYRSDIGEIGYILNPAYWGHGYAKEAIDKLVEVLFNHVGLRRIEALQAVENKSSESVLKHVGFVYEGTLREFFLGKDGKYLDMNYYSILKKEFLARRK